jgi:replicative DNA helicase
MQRLKNNLADIKIAQGVGVSTGFPQLDEVTNGFQKGELTLIAGRPSMGKTAIMIDLAMTAAEHHNTGIFSLEMGRDSLVTRMIANKQNVTYKSLIRGEVTLNDDTKNYLESLNLYIDDRPGITSADIIQTVQEASPKLDIVFIDYLQLVRPPIAKRQRYEEVDKITEHIRNMAKILNVAVVITCQLNRATDQREKHEPRLSDLRESGGIEQVCDKILLLYRPSYYSIYETNQKTDDDSEAWIIVAKQRNGETGRIPIVWIGESMAFKAVNFKLEEQF